MAKVDKMVHLPVSIMVGDSSEMDEAANLVKARVVSEASRNRLTGAYIASIKIDRVPGRQGNGTLVTDRLIYSDDPGAMAIEYGHRIKGFIGPLQQGNVNGKVPGQYIFTRALSKTGWLL